ncbi:hypothetical protein GOBAR_AA18604 [Gossypium barbadense]|uniref:Uncharacterized protein n=1 Tax=Gossypium barbadense TaxID=3634 RepID=A0A2P5XFI2_GOSBA|nr:hypothetical protein GOBAR_AA18604 [Gossypium barbadense]
MEMQLLDDDDLGTMMEIWWSNGNENPHPTELFAELANLEPVEHVNAIKGSDNDEDSNHDVEDFSNLDLDEVSDDIDNEGSEKVEDVHAPSFRNLSRGIILRNDLGAHMLNINPDAAHAPERCLIDAQMGNLNQGEDTKIIEDQVLMGSNQHLILEESEVGVPFTEAWTLQPLCPFW